MAVCFSFSCFSCYFEGVHFLIFICNYLYIRYLYVTIYILDIYIDLRKSVYHIFLTETTETERLGLSDICHLDRSFHCRE